MLKQTPITDLLAAGLTAADMRGRAIANNIANMSTDGYRRYDVQFEEILARKLARSGKVDLSEVAPRAHRPMDTPVGPNGNDVELEREVGQMAKNTAMYRAYMRILGKMYRQMEAAIGGEQREGKQTWH